MNSTQMRTKRIDFLQKKMHRIKLQNNDKLYILNLSNRNHSPTHFHTLEPDNKSQTAKSISTRDPQFGSGCRVFFGIWGGAGAMVPNGEAPASSRAPRNKI
jgi:hypothetical protein